MGLVYGSVCSGIEATTVAWESLGWRPAWFSEIDEFCCEVLRQRYRDKYPEADNLGDMVGITGHPKFQSTHVDLIVAGTPCPAFSTGGLRGGFKDDRGKLTLEYVKILGAKKPEWFVWENVDGVISMPNVQEDGSVPDDKRWLFGTILGEMVECGYGVAYRVLDPQHLGLPQSRPRVFVVGHLGDWAGPERVLFNGYPSDNYTPGGGDKARRIPALTTQTAGNANARGVVVVECTGEVDWADPPCGEDRKWAVRALTPMEEEKRQGFPGDYTAIDWHGGPAPDALRYRAIGNSMAIPVMRWLGERIQEVNDQIKGGTFMDQHKADTIDGVPVAPPQPEFQPEIEAKPRKQHRTQQRASFLPPVLSQMLGRIPANVQMAEKLLRELEEQAEQVRSFIAALKAQS